MKHLEIKFFYNIYNNNTNEKNYSRNESYFN